jgi:AcrR family transcriptional regulator
MARRIPANRFDELVRAATEVFIARGYRLTQMADVAEAIGVAKGTLYGYVESKDALLALCLLCADEEGPIHVPEALPLPSLAAGELGRLVEQRLSAAVTQPRLARALESERAEDPKAELEGVIGEFYDLMSSHRRRIKLLDRCMDHPELAGLWQVGGREHARVGFVAYLEKRTSAGQVRALPNLRLAARMVIETVATWAVHIHWDRSPEPFDSGEVRENVIDFLVRGLLSRP